MRRKLVFAIAAIVMAFGATVLALLGADVLLHRRAERSAGLNIWGYRGPTVPRRHAGQPRVAVLGGSTAFGYGVTWDEAFPAALERSLKASSPGPQWSVVNLGYNNEGAYAFRFTLEDFAYLEPDVVILYEGYNDMVGDDGRNTSLFRHGSPVFVLTGYMPILPLVFHEKAMALTHGGSINAGYAETQGAGTKVVFRPNLREQAAASTLEAAAMIEESIEKQLSRVSNTSAPATAGPGKDACGHPWRHYCASVAAAVDYALSKRAKVIVAGQPRLAEEKSRVRQEDQLRAVRDMLGRRFGGNQDVRFVDLAHVVDLGDRSSAPDGMHLDADSNRRVGESLAPAVLDILHLARTETNSSR